MFTGRTLTQGQHGIYSAKILQSMFTQSRHVSVVSLLDEDRFQQTQFQMFNTVTLRKNGEKGWKTGPGVIGVARREAKGAMPPQIFRKYSHFVL